MTEEFVVPDGRDGAFDGAFDAAVADGGPQPGHSLLGVDEFG